MKIIKRAEFFLDLIYNNFLPYWRKFEDTEHGGICNCINNYGDTKISDDKFIWSQGRYLWILSEIYNDINAKNLSGENKKSILLQMTKTYEFIVNNAIDENNACYFLLNKNGKPLIDKTSNQLHASIFADCFAIIGMASYVRHTNKLADTVTVTNLYKSIVKRIESGIFNTEPYPIAKNYRVHSINMIMLNVTHEYIKMLKQFNIAYSDEIAYAKTKVDFILDKLFDGNLIREYTNNDGIDNDYLLGRHINPGHTLESLWFIVEFLQEYDDLNNYIKKIGKIARTTFDLAWDRDHGGLLRFVDYTGGIPKGKLLGDRYEQLILDTHDMKLWWSHSEALYLFLLLHKITHDDEYIKMYDKVYDYTFRVFPNNEIGEWIQILDRKGVASTKIVALPVKDPFHILRNFIKVINI